MKFGLSENIIEKITRVLEDQPKVEKAYIFGSRAKGNYQSNSDIDIALKGYDLTVEDILRISAAIDKLGIEYKVDLVNYDSIKEQELVEHIDRVGLIFYKRWQDYMLKEVGTLERGKSRHRPRYAFHLYGGKYPFIQTGDIAEGSKYITSYKQTYSEEGLAQSRLWKKGTLCITIAANIAEVAILGIDACFPDSVIGFIPDKQKSDVDYVFYTLTYYQKQLQLMGDGSVQDNINLGTFEQIKFPFPPIKEQKIIADILSSLDNKIDLLHRQNKTLESVGQTLFKQWFVEETSDEFVSLGDYVYNIKEHVKIKNLNIFDHYVGLEHIPRKTITLSNWGSADKLESDKLVFKENDVLFGKLRSYFHKVVFAPIDGVCSTDILVVRPKKKEWFSFCLLWFFSEELVDYSDLASGGTRMPRTNWEILANYQIPKPNPEKMEDFEKIFTSKVKKIKSNISQIRALADLRDTLLPKLLTGEARVKMS